MGGTRRQIARSESPFSTDETARTEIGEERFYLRRRRSELESNGEGRDGAGCGAGGGEAEAAESG